jgi:Arc/MetJ family transcription regulator
VGGGGLSAGQHTCEQTFLPRELAGTDQVHLVVDALEGPSVATPLDLPVGRSLLDELGVGQQAAAATRDRCEDAPVEPELTIHVRTFPSGCDTPDPVRSGAGSATQQVVQPARNEEVEVYRWCMARTNIDIDEEAAQAVMKRYHLRTKREAVNFALRTLAAEALSVEEALAMQGSGWDGDLEEMRVGRVL